MVLWRVLMSCLVFSHLIPEAYAQRSRKARNPDFIRTINQGRRLDPYNPKVRPSTFVGGLQVGTHAEYTLDDPELLFLRYYHTPKVKFYLNIPQIDADYLALGAEYRLGPILGDRSWIGVELRPENTDINIYFRGISKQSRTAKIHYTAYGTVGDGLTVFGANAGYYTRPFRRSKNTFVDSKFAYQLVNTDDDVTINSLNLRGEIGHGWANFAEVKGLELYGSLGLEYASINVSTSVAEQADTSESDVDLRIVLGVLYHTPI
ncbi:hypothetical protein [Pseudobacteriovorax antillogorgiicola]|uniref:Uncharacterized protein n=1 Tax=Pseudobacteriovorax antillogorgiicola TaxID=1513793 RepID=A0A1Y6BGX1_9BACT|nr:hypothetical protein [Pseudobacteriovorax antillogorgiicola]TCS55552.1 hypothetical protein EDD56_105278 [Pseudobacteriovorax antillogorgiicola]SMF11034.1 hypothetical protein SAMN06296036_10546 [Pseudobacteriovorax antillogorgiicola]